MFESLKSCARSLGDAGTGLALVAIASMPMHALAHDDAAAAAPAQLQGPTNSAVSNQMVVRDAASGQLRAATAEEAQVLQRKPAALLRAAPATLLPRVHSSGARGARLTSEFMSYSVAVRQADGSMAMQCVESPEAAAAVMEAAPVVKANTAPLE